MLWIHYRQARAEAVCLLACRCSQRIDLSPFICFQISWVRHRDVHLLTVGRYTYTSDQRFSAHHVPLTHYWQLRIRNVTFDDEGRYECQISTAPPLSHALDLSVVGQSQFNKNCRMLVLLSGSKREKGWELSY